jgi:RimJ/RimL family protein N-acetyltransferase
MSYTTHLHSERLTTRWLTSDDIPAWTAFFDDPEAAEFIPAGSYANSLEASSYMINKQLDRYKNNLFGLQALIDKSTNEFVGMCGLLAQTIDDLPEIEVGYHIFKKHWGKGFAPEAAKMFLDYAFSNNMAESVISVIDVDNKKSRRVAEKNGLLLEKQTTYGTMNVVVYRMQKQDWQKV